MVAILHRYLFEDLSDLLCPAFGSSLLAAVCKSKASILVQIKTQDIIEYR